MQSHILKIYKNSSVWIDEKAQNVLGQVSWKPLKDNAVVTVLATTANAVTVSTDDDGLYESHCPPISSCSSLQLIDTVEGAHAHLLYTLKFQQPKEVAVRRSNMNTTQCVAGSKSARKSWQNKEEIVLVIDITLLDKSTGSPTHYTHRSCSVMETHTRKHLMHGFCADAKTTGGFISLHSMSHQSCGDFTVHYVTPHSVCSPALQ